MKFKIQLDKAVEAAEANLSAHVIELNDATEVWINDVKAALDSIRLAVDRQGIKTSIDKVTALFYARPQDNRLQYGKFIGAMKRAKESGETILEMDEDDYDAVFNDNWEWRKQGKVTNTSYSSRKR